MKFKFLAWRRAMFSAVALFSFSVGFEALAENHALIMWIGEYADPRANLPGIDLDAKNARKIALGMGISEKNITEFKNEQLSLEGMSGALKALVARVAQDDKVFIYYSGHGAQQVNAGGGKKCSEGLVAQDVQLYYDRDLETDLTALGAKASQVVMMADSCFSGGASTKALGISRMLVPKAFPGPVAGAASAVEGYKCGDAVNKGFLTKNLEVVKREGAQLLYMAAAADNEVSYASSEGSIATQAWATCVASPTTDKDQSGSLSGEELRACAQIQINANPLKVHQTVTLTGNVALPISFVSAGAGAKPVATRVNGARVLEDIHAGSDQSYNVTLVPANNTLRIGQDYFDFKVETNREGYLYVLQVGTDGETFNLLFPNDIDVDNRVAAGTHRFPREGWRLRSQGPSGTNYLMALVSSTPKDFNKNMEKAGPFATAPTTRHVTKSLVVVATGASTGSNGRYGASEVAQVHEAP